MPIRSSRDIEAAEQGLSFNRFASTYEFLRNGAEIDPAARALSFFLRVEDHADPVRWTHADWLAEITRTANLFRRLGVTRRDVVAVILPNLPETHMALWGAETAGIVFPVNPLIDGRQMAELLRAVRPSWIVTLGPAPDAEIWTRVEAAIANLTGLRGVLAVDLLTHLPGYAGHQALPDRIAEVDVLDFAIERKREDRDTLGFDLPGADDTASYFCTGGTTGLPKIARHLHRNEVANVLQLAVVVPQVTAQGRTVLTALPLFHVNAQLATGLAVFGHGGHVLLAPPAGYRSPGLIPRFWEIIEIHRVNSFSAVPTVYTSLLQAPRAGRDLSSLNYAICGAAPMPVALFRAVEREIGVRVLEGYGLTESACVASLNPPEAESRIGSIGLRLPGQQMGVMILDEAGDFGRKAAIDEVGAICVSGPNIFPGYLNPAHDSGAWFEMGTAHWFNTGDLGRQDSDGFFWLTGRRKEVIIRGGHNIDPKTIEEVLATHPSVALCAAIGRPDAYAGEVPVAYVQMRADAAIVSESDLLAFAAASITERAAVPKFLRILPVLPVTAVGKVFKPALRMCEIESVVRETAVSSGVSLDVLRVEQDEKHGVVARYRVSEGDRDAFVRTLSSHIFRSEAIE